MTTVSYRDLTAPSAESYERYFVPAIGRPAADVLLPVADLQPGQRVLDVACGTGVVARLAAGRVGASGAVTGIDVAPDMISVARTTPAPAAPAIDWRVGDAVSLPFHDGTFDVVTCQMGLMFMEDRDGAVAEMRRVVATGGRVVVSTPGRIQPPFEAMERAIVEHVNPELGMFVRAVFSMHDPDGLVAILASAGLVDVTAGIANARLQLPAPAEFLWQYISLTPMAPIVAAASDDAKRAIEREVVEAWQPYVVDGRVVAEQPMVIATGRR